MHSKRVLALDGLRGIAIVSVLVLHCFWCESFSFSAKLLDFSVGWGWGGVQLFFVLSGFLLTGILLQEKGRPGYIKAFYIRRFLRILPLYFIFLAAYSLLRGVNPHEGGLCYWTFTSNYRDVISRCAPLGPLGTLWSLAVEEQFYLLLPALVTVTSVRGLRRVLVAAIILSVAFRAVAVLALGRYEAAYWWTPANLDGFAVGGLIATVDPLEARAKLRPVATLAFTAAIAFFVGLGVAGRQFIYYGNPKTLLTFGTPAVVLASGALLALGLTSERVGTWLSVPVLRWFGKYSYAMYILHGPVREAFERGLATWLPGVEWSSAATQLLVGPLTIGITAALALLSWHFIEAPMLRWKGRLAPRTGGPPSLEFPEKGKKLSAGVAS
jgi:peptidoglycan/LPS O-acetylase OafA/YrhL